MPRVTVTVAAPIHNSFRVQQVAGMFGLSVVPESRETFSAEVPGPEEDWKIGAIVGPSGSGKTTLAARAFGAALVPAAPWPSGRAVIDCFGEHSTRHIVQALTAVGFSSPPAWLRPFVVLSNGEKFRCELARALLGPTAAGNEVAPTVVAPAARLVVFDEFTSVVDRTVAQVGSAALAKALRGGQLACRFVAVSCHYDILPWLEPDWVLDLAAGELRRGRLRRPPIQLSLVRCTHQAWPLFARHHYLGGQVPAAAQCYLALWNEEPVAFCAVAGLFGYRGRKRLSRIVVLPDYQGLGVGMPFAEQVCRLQRAAGFRVNLTASHPAVIAHCGRSPLWRTVNVSPLGHLTAQFHRGQRFRGSQGRGVVSFEFVGETQHESARPPGPA